MRFRNIARKIQCLKTEENGTTAVEMAMVLPVLLVLLFGIIELSVGMFVNTVVEGGLRDASRVGLTGMDTGGISREQSIVNIVNDASLGLLNLTTADVSSLIYPSFADIGQPEPYTDLDGDGDWSGDPVTHDGTYYPDGEPFEDINGNGRWDEDMGTAGLGGPGEIVLYTIAYNWNLLSGQFLPILGGIIPMQASMVVRNEPF